MRAIAPERIVEHMSHARETLAGLYYDTAVSSLAPTVAAVKELAGAGRMTRHRSRPGRSRSTT